jgi:UDP-3-O-[3-hydroxymyristoyl] glucosamine N-acyltransferase
MILNAITKAFEVTMVSLSAMYRNSEYTAKHRIVSRAFLEMEDFFERRLQITAKEIGPKSKIATTPSFGSPCGIGRMAISMRQKIGNKTILTDRMKSRNTVGIGQSSVGVLFLPYTLHAKKSILNKNRVNLRG